MKVESRHSLLGLLQQLYAAPGTVHGWNAFLESLRVALDGSAASFISHDLQSHRGSISVNAGADSEALCLYDLDWAAPDPWAHSPALGTIGRRSVGGGDELISHAWMRRTAYYEDFARRYDIVRSVAGMVELGPDVLSVISINGSDRREPFGERDVALLELLVPHIRRAVQLHRRLIAADSQAEGFAAVLDSSSRAVLLTDAGGRVMFMNQAASRLTATRDGLTVDSGELRAARVADTRRLRSLVIGAAAVCAGDGIGGGSTLALSRPSGRRPFVVFVAPLSRQRPFFPGVEHAAATVFINDPEQLPVPSNEALQALFGLTNAEAKLARLLTQGCTLRESGARLGLRRETARTRLKTIFEKTNTHRQAELVRLILNGAPEI
jgi:DNA-binding CsgD family transcriptional regulator/PAS domain-containing protein